ncbi:hypothetical protein A33Q_1818 [Indibacter alkaliphilus LW1]|uniref:Uncharacterized protein n=1 Tax=Indibacter alkaliphilus (strain CCUG 57479 / KCTC 22604 / LW1) TaxID=1189612 RepID=S2DIY1_INDAL|nr:hypothetical protein A33Q_1818 [Indibacter alkaliphilus LW1]
MAPSENPSAMCGFRAPTFGFQKAGSNKLKFLKILSACFPEKK